MNVKLRIAAGVVAVLFVIACGGQTRDEKEWIVVTKSSRTDAQTREVTYLVRCRVKGGTEEKVVTVSKARWEGINIENFERCPGT